MNENPDQSQTSASCSRGIHREPLAIVGMSCRLPGAPDPQSYWQMLCDGKRAIKGVPKDRWPSLADAPPGTLKGGYLDDIAGFDWRALRMLPREARQMDPQHRLLLELAWEAIEDAGLSMDAIAGSQTGVFIGIQWNDYFLQLARDWSKLDGYAMVGNPSMFAANRISYSFDLRGPSVAMDTGCTSSLSALQNACESLWLGESDQALVGAAEIILSHGVLLGMDRAGLLSKSGMSRPLDKNADGFLRGEGGGMLVLKRMSDVREDERVYAQVAGVATRHSGAGDWIMATSSRAQGDAIQAACRQGGIEPKQLEHVEVHAAGSPRGDPVEIEVLSGLIGGAEGTDNLCNIGSVKGNIGHLGAAAGMASLIKVALSFHHGMLPPTLVPDEELDELMADDSGLKLGVEAQPFIAEDGRVGFAGVTSLSLGGLSAHAVLGTGNGCGIAAHSDETQPQAPSAFILPISAQNAEALNDLAQRYVALLKGTDHLDIASLCYTAAIGRTHREHRLAVAGRTAQELASAIEATISGAAGARDVPRSLRDLITRYMAGEDLDWTLVSFDEGKISSLPLYPWQRQRMWPDWLSPEQMGAPSGAIATDQSQDVKQGHLPQTKSTVTASTTDTLNHVARRAAQIFERSESDVLAAEMLTELGLDSLTASELARILSADFDLDIPIAAVLRRPNVTAIADLIGTRLRSRHLDGLGGQLSEQLQPDFEKRYDPFPLTDIQTAYWIGRTATDALGGVGCHYYQEFEHSSLDVGKLQRAFNALIARHDMLRAVISPEGQQQIIANVETYKIETLNLQDANTAQVQAGIETVRGAMETTRFDPAVWPLFEVRAVLLAQDRVRVHLSFDLLTVDAVSLSQLIREWEMLYIDPEALAPLDVSFRDYVLDEQADRDGDRFKSDLAYWDARLTDLKPAPGLPSDTINVPEGVMVQGQSLPRSRRKGRLPAQAWDALRGIAGARGLTPSSVLCSAFSEILGTWGGGQHFTLNLTYCSRRKVHPRMSEMVGDFTTTILLDVDRRPDTFAARAETLQNRLSEDMGHAAVSGVEVLRRLRRDSPEDGLAVMPVVFTSLLGHGATSGETLFSSNWLGELVYGISQTPQVSLDHQAFEENGDLVFHWDAVEDVFPAGVLDDMFTAYLVLLEDLTRLENWDAAQQVHVPPSQEARKADVNNTSQDLPTGLLHTPFLEQATAAPDREAIIDGDCRMTYREVDQRSLALAHTLRDADVHSGALVAIVMEKGWEQIVAAMAILRAGAAYVPIDASLPPARIAHILENCDVTVALVQSHVALPHVEGATITSIAVNEQPVPSSNLPDLNVEMAIDQMAYAIFTSGSTGVPKGVMISHGAARNTVEDINHRFDVGPTDRVLALSSMSFDLSVYDVFGLLGVGGAVVIPPRGSERDPQSWHALMQHENVTVWNSVPALMTLLTEYGADRMDGTLGDLRLVLLSGDWIPVSAYGAIKAIAPRSVPVGLGGATEASIWSIFHPLEQLPPEVRSVPYGKPLANQTMHVLDPACLTERPDLVTGEIFIGGDGIAMGYWKNPSETDHRFVIQQQTGRRLYRTGDLGRYLSDGTIEMLGRADFQVKIQGHRIELGEIETVLRAHDTVAETIVVTSADAAGRQRLAAFVIPHQIKTAHIDGLRDWAREQLPAYMVPENIIVLEALPLTENGKIDRKKLSKLAKPKPSVDVKPTNNIEQALARVVADVLGVQSVSIEDSFLSLGCTSIDFVRIHRGMAGFAQREVPVVEMFSHTNIRSLATALAVKEDADPSDRAERRKARMEKSRGQARRRARGRAG